MINMYEPIYCHTKTFSTEKEDSIDLYPDHPFEIIMLEGYKSKEDVLSIKRLNKPNRVTMYKPLLREDVFHIDLYYNALDCPIDRTNHKMNNQYLAIGGPNSSPNGISSTIMIVSSTSFSIRYVGKESPLELIIHCVSIPRDEMDTHLLLRVDNWYRNYFIPEDYTCFEPKMISVTSQTKLLKNIQKYNPSIKSIKTISRIEDRIMPRIKKVIINSPAVIVFWSDDTKTVSKCMKNDIFNPETGLAMAISKKYYETLGARNPRAAFKKALKQAEDQSAKTAEKRAKKAN